MLCDCYHELPNDEAECWGTKEREKCYCEGVEALCNFYPEKRKERKTMNTAEMWLKAQEDGKQYRCCDVLYSKDTGLVAAEDFKHKWSVKAWANNSDIDICREFDNLMNESWKEVIIPTITRAEAESKFGVKIID